MEEVKEVNKGGRPRLYTLDTEGQQRWSKDLDNYIKSITYYKPKVDKFATDKKDKNGNIVTEERLLTDREGNVLQELAFAAIPSMLGLANYLDIGKDAVIEYSKKEGFSDSYKKVMDIIEEYTANLLQTKSNVAGVIFTLKNNFNWQDKKEIEVTSKTKLEDFFND